MGEVRETGSAGDESGSMDVSNPVRERNEGVKHHGNSFAGALELGKTHDPICISKGRTLSALGQRPESKGAV